MIEDVGRFGLGLKPPSSYDCVCHYLKGKEENKRDKEKT